MAYDLTDLTTTGQLKKLATRVNAELGKTIRYVAVSGNTVNFYNEKSLSDPVQEPAFSVDFPSELFLDQAATTLVQDFAWSAATYPNSTNPNLDGKQVLVLGVKTQTANGTSTIAYSFVDLTSLIEVVEIASGDSSKILSISSSGKTTTITVHISALANNAITVEDDGLHVNITGKADKVDREIAAIAANPYNETTEATDYATFNTNYSLNNHVALLDGEGNLKDSGITLAADAEIDEMITEVFGA